MITCMRALVLFLAVECTAANKTAAWLDARADLIDAVYGKGRGVLPTRSIPDRVEAWPEDRDPRSKGLRGLVWNMSTLFEITSTVFYSPLSGDPTKRSSKAFLFHHGHSNCVCPGSGTLAVRCQPGCNSSMPTLREPVEQYTWWDLYNVSTFFHSLGYDVFILSMPLKGVNIGPGSNETFVNSDHWWFLQWEEKGDAALRYFLEPAYLTVNYAVANGYTEINMAGLSGGGWSTTFASAIDRRITSSFPIAGSVPCAMRNPLAPIPGQLWSGNDAEDFEQSCRPTTPVLHPTGRNDRAGRAAFGVCNYTCQYLLAGLEPHRYQVQILHEYDSCCFSPHNRHSQMLAYELNVRAELGADERAGGKHGWFTVTATNHSKHEVAAQGKTIIAAALHAHPTPGAAGWEQLPCDVMHQRLPANCAPNVDPGLPTPYVPMCGDSVCTCTQPPAFPCMNLTTRS